MRLNGKLCAREHVNSDLRGGGLAGLDLGEGENLWNLVRTTKFPRCWKSKMSFDERFVRKTRHVHFELSSCAYIFTYIYTVFAL